MSLTSKQFQKYLDRDKRCYHCGTSDGTLIPQHRINRGMGGSKKLDTPSNIIVFCSMANFLIESSAEEADRAKRYGWKLERWQDTTSAPVFDLASGVWFVIDNSYNRTETREQDADNQGQS
jgi:hypothetical protein